METALYYTFSTIPQVVAGAIAFLGAFALFKMQYLNRGLERRSESIEKLYFDKSIIKKVQDVIKGDLSEDYYRDVKQMIKEGQIDYKIFIYQFGKIENATFIKKSLKKIFWVSLVISVILILFSIIVLILTPKFFMCSYFSYSVFSVGIILLMACLTLYIILIKKALE